MASPGEITQLLRQWGGGDPAALTALFELVYPDLKRIAQALFREESSASLLQPTSMVNELYMKLVKQNRLRLEDRNHFFNLAARLMRRMLVDYARSAGRKKRDGGVPITLREDMSWMEADPGSIVDLDRALNELQEIDDRKCRIVELHFFLGFTLEETAELVGASKATVDRDLKFARGWLQDRLGSLND
jgi:RNA polymerase sigma factor (TIGR02999 family)